MANGTGFSGGKCGDSRPRLSTGQSPVAVRVGVAVGAVCVERTLPPAALDVDVDVVLDVELMGCRRRRRNRGRAALKRRVKLML
jgi:hypothetical protein